VAPTCRALCDAAKLAQKARPFSARLLSLDANRNDDDVDDDGWRIHRSILSVRVAADDRTDDRVITGGRDGGINIWRDGECTHNIDEHNAHGVEIQALAVLPDGASFISAAEDGAVMQWKLDSSHERTFHVGGPVIALALLPDGEHFVVGFGDTEETEHPHHCRGDVRLYQFDGSIVHTFTGHTGSVTWNGLAVTRDGQHIISGAEDDVVKVWSVADKRLLSTCVGHRAMVFAVATTPNEQLILSGSHDTDVRVWLFDGTLVNLFTHLHGGAAAGDSRFGACVCALVAVDNQCALSGSNDHTVKLFSISDGDVLRTFIDTCSIYCLALLPDGLRFVYGADDGTATIAYHGLYAPQ
jgi:WD40 repeat protein